MFAVAQVIL